MNVGDALVRIRAAKGLTQAELGERARLATSYVSRIENGWIQPTAKMLQRLATALEVPVADLFAAPNEPLAAPHICPVSETGECIGRLIRSREKTPRVRSKAKYSDEALHMLRLTDYLVNHGSAEVRAALRTVLEALIQRTGAPKSLDAKGPRRRTLD
jgi:transcriptional regulator with XRE-family HTH domain